MSQHRFSVRMHWVDHEPSRTAGRRICHDAWSDDLTAMAHCPITDAIPDRFKSARWWQTPEETR